MSSHEVQIWISRTTKDELYSGATLVVMIVVTTLCLVNKVLRYHVRDDSNTFRHDLSTAFACSGHSSGAVNACTQVKKNPPLMKLTWLRSHYLVILPLFYSATKVLTVLT